MARCGFRLIAGALAVAAVAGCGLLRNPQADAERLMRAPNAGFDQTALDRRDQEGWKESGITNLDRVGWKLGRIALPDGTSLAYWTIDPLGPGYSYREERKPPPEPTSGDRHVRHPVRGALDNYTGPLGKPERTVLLLNGWYGHKYQLGWVGRVMANHGYRAIALDLPGHGASTGDRITFGAQERLQVAASIRHLRDQGTIIGGLGLIGYSMGASVALLVAADVPEVEAVVAVAPYADPQEALRSAVPMLAGWFSWMISRGYLDQVIAACVTASGRPADAAAPQAAMGQVRCPVLLVHGEQDTLIPAWHSTRLDRLSSHPRTLLVTIPGADHLSVTEHLRAWSGLIGIWMNAQVRRYDTAATTASQKP